VAIPIVYQGKRARLYPLFLVTMLSVAIYAHHSADALITYMIYIHEYTVKPVFKGHLCDKKVVL